MIQLIAGDDGIAFLIDPQLLCDGKGCDLVVAGDHNGADAGLAASAHGFRHLPPRRV